MSHLFEQPDGATPLDPDECEGLVATSITTRGELNEAEAINIAAGATWASRQRKFDLLTDEFVRRLHKRMFGDVWKWAGSYRLTEKNIGINPSNIPAEVRSAIDDTRFWVEHKAYETDELCVRFHHRLVFIHPFPNGNGRHARLMADLMRLRLGGEPFAWGRINLGSWGEARKIYIAALKAADSHDISALLAFARS